MFFFHTLSYLFGFSIVFQDKLWWQLQTLFLQILFLVRRRLMILVAKIIMWNRLL